MQFFVPHFLYPILRFAQGRKFRIYLLALTAFFSSRNTSSVLFLSHIFRSCTFFIWLTFRPCNFSSPFLFRSCIFFVKIIFSSSYFFIYAFFRPVTFSPMHFLSYFCVSFSFFVCYIPWCEHPQTRHASETLGGFGYSRRGTRARLGARTWFIMDRFGASRLIMVQSSELGQAQLITDRRQAPGQAHPNLGSARRSARRSTSFDNRVDSRIDMANFALTPGSILVGSGSAYDMKVGSTRLGSARVRGRLGSGFGEVESGHIAESCN